MGKRSNHTHIQETTIDQVVVYKSKREMQLRSESNIVKTYQISLGANPIGHKEQEGDERTPEGTYILDWRKPKKYACWVGSQTSQLSKQSRSKKGKSKGMYHPEA